MYEPPSRPGRAIDVRTGTGAGSGWGGVIKGIVFAIVAVIVILFLIGFSVSFVKGFKRGFKKGFDNTQTVVLNLPPPAFSGVLVAGHLTESIVYTGL